MIFYSVDFLHGCKQISCIYFSIWENTKPRLGLEAITSHVQIQLICIMYIWSIVGLLKNDHAIFGL
jgi:hypothetical protein